MVHINDLNLGDKVKLIGGCKATIKDITWSGVHIQKVKFGAITNLNTVSSTGLIKDIESILLTNA